MKAPTLFANAIAQQISMPEVYTDIRKMIDNDNSTIQDFVEIISKDRMLTSRLMQIAKSNYFGFPTRANDLYQAISLIGIMQMHDLILNCLCLRTFSSIPQQIFNLRAFWQYSVECGIAARTLAQYAQIFPLNPYFTLGLLHEIGHAVMFVRNADLSVQALEAAQNEGLPLVEKEQAMFGFDYTEVGLAVMQQWGLPARFQQVSSLHLQPEHADEAHLQAVNIINLAHRICENPHAENISEQLIHAQQLDPQLKKLPDNIVDIIIKEVASNTSDVLAMLLPYQEQDSDGNERQHN